jgi:hypothetical protein
MPVYAVFGHIKCANLLYIVTQDGLSAFSGHLATS